MTDALREALQELVSAIDAECEDPGRTPGALQRARTALQEPAPAVAREPTIAKTKCDRCGWSATVEIHEASMPFPAQAPVEPAPPDPHELIWCEEHACHHTPATERFIHAAPEAVEPAPVVQPDASAARNVLYGRCGDMTPRCESVLRILIQEDGDVCLSIQSKEDEGWAGIEFCANGGQSVRTLHALHRLAAAVAADNEAAPRSVWPPTAPHAPVEPDDQRATQVESGRRDGTPSGNQLVASASLPNRLAALPVVQPAPFKVTVAVEACRGCKEGAQWDVTDTRTDTSLSRTFADEDEAEWMCEMLNDAVASGARP